MTAFYAVMFVMSVVLICKWTLSHYDDDDDDDVSRLPLDNNVGIKVKKLVHSKKTWNSVPLKNLVQYTRHTSLQNILYTDVKCQKHL